MRGVPRERSAISPRRPHRWDLEHFCRALNDDAQFFFGVKLQAQQNAETRAQRRREQAGPRGGPMKVKGLISITWVRAAGPWR